MCVRMGGVLVSEVWSKTQTEKKNCHEAVK
jgi:hypothetical protein